MDLRGMRVIPHPLAEKVERVARITRTPIKKRRRGWQLRYETIRTPCAFVVGSTVYIHPAAVAKLRAHSIGTA
jgi:hypothetical protein